MSFSTKQNKNTNNHYRTSKHVKFGPPKSKSKNNKRKRNQIEKDSNFFTSKPSPKMSFHTITL